MIPWKRGGRPKRANPEERFHVEVARFLNLALPKDAWWTTIPTVGSSMIQGAKLKAKGYKAGTPDIIICCGSKAYWLELKAPDGVVSHEQREQYLALRNAGCIVWVARTLDHVQQGLEHWGIPLRATLAPEPAAVKGARETA